MRGVLRCGSAAGFFYVCLVCCAVVLTGCDDDPAPEPVEIFTLTVDPSYDLHLDTWVFLHASNGALLDHRQVTGVGDFTFSGAGLGDGDVVSLTVFNYDTTILAATVRNTHGLSTYHGLPLNGWFALATPQATDNPTAGAEQGKMFVNYETPAGTTMDILSNGFDVGTFWRPTPETKAGSVMVYEKSNDVLLSVVADGTPRYLLFRDAVPGTTFDVGLADMLAFDQVLSIALPSPAVNPTMKVLAYDGDGFNRYHIYNNEYNISPHAPAATYTSVNLGFLTMFATYDIDLQIPQPDYFYTYRKVGAMPGALTLPAESPFTLTDRSFTTFAYEASQDFTFRVSDFRLKNTPPGDNTYWQIVSPPGNDRILELPEDFTAMYPFIVIDNFQHVSSSFETTTDDYFTRVDGMLKGTAGHASEFESVVFGAVY